MGSASAHGRHGGILHNEDLGKLWENPVYAALAVPGDKLHGRLMSFSASMARGEAFFDPNKQGDYDGASDIPRVVFGGTLAPDVAAQELFEAGLIKGPTPDALWEALKREAASVIARKLLFTVGAHEGRKSGSESGRKGVGQTR